MDEQTVQRLYIEKPDDEVKLFCSHTTRPEGFLDILLAGAILSSDEVMGVLGTVKTHRGSQMNSEGSEYFHHLNNYIAFSTGLVSYKYTNRDILSREDYFGGLGVFVPLEKILKFSHLGFSHCSHAGGIKNYNLDRENILPAVCLARRNDELHDDGFGNVFEVVIEAELQEGNYPRRVISYPRFDLTDGVIAIPESERKKIGKRLVKRREMYKQFLDKISGRDFEDMRGEIIGGRKMYYVEALVPFMQNLVKPFDIESLPVFWYKDRNLDIAMQRLSIGAV